MAKEFNVTITSEAIRVGFADAKGISRSEWLWGRRRRKLKKILEGCQRRNDINFRWNKFDVLALLTFPFFLISDAVGKLKRMAANYSEDRWWNNR